jgi:hypothetical protein
VAAGVAKFRAAHRDGDSADRFQPTLVHTFQQQQRNIERLGYWGAAVPSAKLGINLRPHKKLRSFDAPSKDFVR